MSRSRFGAIDETGDIVLAWQDGGRSFGYTSGLVDRLESGRSVVAAAPSGCGADIVARTLWSNVVVVHLEPGTEKLRIALGPMASLQRSNAPVAADSIWQGKNDVRLHDLGSLPLVVRALTTELTRLCPKTAPSDARPRSPAPAPAEPIRPGARSSLAAKNRRKPMRKPIDAPVRRSASPARAITST